jgi:hypothetical protein
MLACVSIAVLYSCAVRPCNGQLEALTVLTTIFLPGLNVGERSLMGLLKPQILENRSAPNQALSVVDPIPHTKHKLCEASLQRAVECFPASLVSINVSLRSNE